MIAVMQVRHLLPQQTKLKLMRNLIALIYWKFISRRKIGRLNMKAYKDYRYC